MTKEQFDLALRLEGILMPYAREQRETFYAGTDGIKPYARFVHYTSAEAALSIIRSKRIWMRNTNCMADYREVQHGFDLLKGFFSDENRRQPFYEALDAISPNLAAEAISLFDQWWANIRFHTYITSISEHDDREDLHGRLSMWRAFGGNTARIGFVFRLPWFSGVTEALNLLFSPAAYLEEAQLHAQIAQIIENIRANRDFLLSIDRPIVLHMVFTMLVAAATCLKHEGFREEREWRLIYLPHMRFSELIESAIEVVGGIPQIIYKLPLDATVSEVLSDLDFARIFDRLIIGPSQFPLPIYAAFTKALRAAGVEQPESRVLLSGIPIRS